MEGIDDDSQNQVADLERSLSQERALIRQLKDQHAAEARPRKRRTFHPCIVTTDKCIKDRAARI